MTLQELLKNDEDKRSDHGGKSGECLANGGGIRWRRSLSAAAVTCSSRCGWHPSITVSVTGKTGHRHQTQMSLLEWLPLKSITASLADVKNPSAEKARVFTRGYRHHRSTTMYRNMRQAQVRKRCYATFYVSWRGQIPLIEELWGLCDNSWLQHRFISVQIN